MSSQTTVDSMVTADTTFSPSTTIQLSANSKATSNENITPQTIPSPSTSQEKYQTQSSSASLHKDTITQVKEAEAQGLPFEETKSPYLKSSSQSEYEVIARKLFREEFISIQPEEYTQFLAANDEESTQIRDYYMDLFKWDANLLTSTRMLCSKLYLKGESQEIDRILSSFTRSYIKQYPVNIFCTKNFEKIYIINYSLILLNTALHNSELNKKSKISETDYIKNTFTTFIQQNPKSSKKLSIKQRIIIERELSNFYEDLSRHELHLKRSEDEASETRNYQVKQSPQKVKLAPISVGTSTTSTSTTNVTATPFADSQEVDFPPLSRPISGSSIWSTDTANNRRASLIMKRMSSANSSVSQFTAVNTSVRSDRVGFTRALVSDQNQQRFYQNGNNSRTSNVSSATYTIRNRQSLDHLRGAPTTAQTTHIHGLLNKRASRSSIISKESVSSHTADDTLSVLSFDKVNVNNLDFIEDFGKEHTHQQQLENFNIDDYQDQYDLKLELQGSPYLKEGLLKLKVLNNDQQDSSIQPDMSSTSSVTSTASTSSASKFFSFFRSSSSTNANSSLFVNTTVGTPNSILPNKFVENFVVVSKGELSLYSFDPKIIKKHQQKIRKLKQKQILTITEFDDEYDDDDDTIGDGNWLKNAANVGTYNLCLTFAQLEMPTHSSTSQSKKSILWSLTFPKVSKKSPKKFIFEAGTKEIALEFINTCNFWAAKITAIPTLEESVSSIEYGWTDLDGLIAKKGQFKKLKNINKWEPLPTGIYLSSYAVNDGSDKGGSHLGMMKQFAKTLKYYNHLKKLYYEFTHMKVKFLKNLPAKQYGCSNYTKIVNNYDLKILGYKSELNKYKNYLIILGFGLSLRFDLEQQDKEAILEETSKAKENENEKETTSSVPDPSVEDDDGLTKIVKFEIRRLFLNTKDVGNVIPTFQSSRSIHNLTQLTKHQILSEDPNATPFPLVKSPKTFTLSNYKDNESPINQLLQSTTLDEAKSDMIHSFSTNTIKEEDEPEDQELERPDIETKVDNLEVALDAIDSSTSVKIQS